MLRPVLSIVLFVVVAGSGLTKSEFEAYKAAHPQEFSGEFEGDIVNPVQSNGFRNALIGRKKWVGGILYYNVTGTTAWTRFRVRKVLKDFEEKLGGCIKFRERVDEPHYVKVINGNGCSSYVGRYGGKQVLSLADPGCTSDGTIQHEFMHALGFSHEQSRSDRDKYLELHLENVQPDMRYNFEKKNTDNVDLPYEYGSVMQYGRYAFSSNGKPTMTAKKPGIKLGRNELHARDIEMIRRYYKCDKNGANIGTEQCADQKSDCLKTKYMCWSKNHQDYMIRYCEKTCGVCDGKAIGPAECLDELETKCKESYSVGSRFRRSCDTLPIRQICKKTCGACDEKFDED